MSRGEPDKKLFGEKQRHALFIYVSDSPSTWLFKKVMTSSNLAALSASASTRFSCALSTSEASSTSRFSRLFRFLVEFSPDGGFSIWKSDCRPRLVISSLLCSLRLLMESRPGGLCRLSSSADPARIPRKVLSIPLHSAKFIWISALSARSMDSMNSRK